MLDVQLGRFWGAVFVREWWQWFDGFPKPCVKNRSGLHGYRFWWHVGPFQVQWGRHAENCLRCRGDLRCC